MAGLPSIPNIPGAGRLQRRAAELKARMEAKAKQKAEEDKDKEAAKKRKKEDEGVGPVGEGEYEVGQGECISSIAKKAGHFWEKIWNDPANAELKDARKDPNVLLPKDRVTIPEKEKKYESGETEMRHRFVRRGEPAFLRMQILIEHEPVGDAPYTLEIDGKTSEGSTDSDGWVDRAIPGDAKRGKLMVDWEGTWLVYALNLGGINPIEDIGGVQQRLKNLGFKIGGADGKLGPRTKAALMQFQHDHTLPSRTGEIDEATRTKLKEIHGS